MIGQRHGIRGTRSGFGECGDGLSSARPRRRNDGPLAVTPGKRLFDIVLALLAVPTVVLAMVVIGSLILIVDGRPVFYVSERMRDPVTPFRLWKFRTMRPDPADHGATGGHKADRLTRCGPFLRRTHLDELPQLFNILRGDMSFVGPRAPLRVYVEAAPDLYARVLKSRPGLTGLATLIYRHEEARLLAGSRSAEETEAIYRRRCVPRKARLDLIYQRNRSICLDLWIILRTVLHR